MGSFVPWRPEGMAEGVAVSAVLRRQTCDVNENRVYGLYALDRETLQRVFWLLGWVQANTGLEKEPLLRDLQDRLAKTFLVIGDAEPLPEVLTVAGPLEGWTSHD